MLYAKVAGIATASAAAVAMSDEKSLAEYKDKVDPTTVEAIELAVAALKDTLEGDKVDKIKAGINNVRDASMKLGEAIYKAQQDKGESSDEPRPVDDDIVDADFEDLDNNKRRG